VPYSFAAEIKKTPTRKLPGLFEGRHPDSENAEIIRTEIAARKLFWIRLRVAATIAAVIVGIAVPVVQNWSIVTQTVSAWLT
jgi:hypothetical protein